MNAILILSNLLSDNVLDFFSQIIQINSRRYTETLLIRIAFKDQPHYVDFEVINQNNESHVNKIVDRPEQTYVITLKPSTNIKIRMFGFLEYVSYIYIMSDPNERIIIDNILLFFLTFVFTSALLHKSVSLFIFLFVFVYSFGYNSVKLTFTEEVYSKPYYEHFNEEKYDFQIDIDSIKSKLENYNFSKDKCEICPGMIPKNRYKAKGTKKDLIITTAINKDYRGSFEAFCKTLRATGCVSPILLLTDDKYIKTNASYCGVIIEKVVPPVNYKAFNLYTRWFVFPILCQHLNGTINNVLYCDVRDTVFQADPFISSFYDDQQFIYTIDTTYKAKNWFKQVPFFFKDRYDVIPQICSGIFGGHIDKVYIITKIMSLITIRKVICMDQVLLHGLYLSDVIMKQNFSKLARHNEGYLNLIGSMDKITKNRRLGSIYYTLNGTYYPHILHQTAYYRVMVNLIQDQCRLTYNISLSKH